MTRPLAPLLSPLVAAALLACADGPRLTAFSGLPVDPDETSVTLDVFVGDRLPLVVETLGPGGRPVRVWTLYAPPGWTLDPDTGRGTWEVLPGTPGFVHLELLLQAGRDGRGPARAYAVHAEVLPAPDDTDLPADTAPPDEASPPRSVP